MLKNKLIEIVTGGYCNDYIYAEYPFEKKSKTIITSFKYDNLNGLEFVGKISDIQEKAITLNNGIVQRELAEQIVDYIIENKELENIF